MTDERFDEELGARLRSYEARLASAEPPSVPAAARSHGWVPAVAVATAVIVAAGAGLALATRSPVGQQPSSPPASLAASPSAAVVPTATPPVAESPTASVSPTATPVPVFPPAAATIPSSWTKTAEFVEDGARYLAGGLTSWNGGLVAVGTRYETDGRNVFGGPPPHQGRVWVSDDGAGWSDVTPAQTFDNVELVDLYVASDGAMIVIGRVWEGDTTYDPRLVFYESADGRAWAPAQLEGLPSLGYRPVVSSGPRGYAAIGYELPDDARSNATAALFHSLDGRHWERTWWPEADAGGPIEEAASVDAGDEGFVALVRSTSTSGAARVMASADGRTWFDGATPTPLAAHVVNRYGDWILADFAELEDRSTGQTVTTWFSANGLDWVSQGEVALGTRDLGDPCPSSIGGLYSVGPYLVMRTVLSWGCGEGAIYHPGDAYITGGGGHWEALPFDTLSSVEAIAEVDDRLVVLADGGTGTPSGGVVVWTAPVP